MFIINASQNNTFPIQTKFNCMVYHSKVHFTSQAHILFLQESTGEILHKKKSIT